MKKTPVRKVVPVTVTAKLRRARAPSSTFHRRRKPAGESQLVELRNVLEPRTSDQVMNYTASSPRVVVRELHSSARDRDNFTDQPPQDGPSLDDSRPSPLALKKHRQTPKQQSHSTSHLPDANFRCWCNTRSRIDGRLCCSRRPAEASPTHRIAKSSAKSERDGPSLRPATSAFRPP